MSDSSKDNNSQSADDESLIDFPCDFPIKVMGADVADFHTCIHEIAKKHDPKYDAAKTKKKISKTGKYVSLTLSIYAENKPQLDKLYQELTDHDLVLWAL